MKVFSLIFEIDGRFTFLNILFPSVIDLSKVQPAEKQVETTILLVMKTGQVTLIRKIPPIVASVVKEFGPLKYLVYFTSKARALKLH